VSNGFVGASLFAVSMIPSPVRRKEGEGHSAGA
jgi:hypothetical protein